jgi:glycosyltransferase involved in cell wall biosynthesis
VVGVIYGEYAHIDGKPVQSDSDLGKGLRRIRRRLTRQTEEAERSAGFLKALKQLKADVVLAEFGPSGVRVLPACKRLGIPLVVVFHGFDAYRTSTLERWGPAYPELFAYASTIVAVSEPMKRQLVALGAPTEQLIVNPCGVDCDTFCGASPKDAPPALLAVGRFVEKKAPHLTILAFHKALREVPEAHLHIVGHGHLHGACQAIVDALGIRSNVTMHGILNSPQIRSLMVTSRAFVQHSIRSTDGDSEGTPVGILEASAAGLPVISTLHAGIPDAVVNKLTGLLVEEGDVNGMGAHMADLLTQPARAHDLGIRAREHMLNRYSMPERIQTLIEAIERAFASGRGNISALKKVKMPATQESLESTTTISGATVWHRRTR